MRTLKNVATEMSRPVLANNMTRVMDIMDMPAMIAEETSIALKFMPNMPDPTQLATTDPAIHPAHQNDDLTPKRYRNIENSRQHRDQQSFPPGHSRHQKILLFLDRKPSRG